MNQSTPLFAEWLGAKIVRGTRATCQMARENMKGPFLRKWARSFSPPYVPMQPGLPRGKADEQRWYAIDETMAFAKRAIALDSQSQLHAALDILQWWAPMLINLTLHVTIIDGYFTGRTLLHMASIWGKNWAIKQLLLRKADPNYKRMDM